MLTTSRKDSPCYGIRTNNYIESFHHHLKHFYLTHARKQPIDVLLYVLTEQLLPDMQRADLRVSLGFDAPRLSLPEVEARRTAQALDSALAQAMIELPTNATEVRMCCPATVSTR
jgi:hypothetical protein